MKKLIILLSFISISIAQQNFFGQVLFEKTFSNYLTSVYGVVCIRDTFYVSGISTMYNWWYRFDKDFTFIDSTIQIKATPSYYSFGFRGLATDNKVIYAGYDQSQKIFIVNPFDMDTLSHITNKDNFHHHSLTYDPVEKVLWSIEPKRTTTYPGFILKINPSTGQTIKKLNIPNAQFSPYGLGIDRYNLTNNKLLWSTQNMVANGLHFYLLDTNNGSIIKDFPIGNIYEKFIGFGLHIISHPEFPNKVIAVLVGKKTDSQKMKILFMDITLNDSPDMPTNVNVTANNKQVTINWNNPTKDLLGNNINIDSLYVVRNDTVIAKLSGDKTSYEDQVELPGMYGYKIIAYKNGRGGLFSETKFVGVGLMINETFEGIAANSLPAGWTKIDGYNDNNTWHVNGYYASNHTPGGVNVLACSWNSNNPKNDWAFTPALNLKKNTTYKLNFYTTTAETEWKTSYGYPEVLSIEIMKSNTDTTQKETTLFDGYINSPNFWVHNYEFNVSEDGNYYLAFHAKSKKDMAYIYVDDITMYEKVSNPTSIENNKELTFNLYQNYPNPFNPVTNIKFELPFNANVKLTIYNLLGQEITTLVNGYMNKGIHLTQFNGANLTSGIYFYKLDISGEKNISLTKQMMLIK